MSDLCYNRVACPSFFPKNGDCETLNHDLRITAGCLDEGDPIISAVIIQLLSDRRDEDTQTGGFWGDQFIGFPLGSRLHTRVGRASSRNINALLDQDIREALDPLIDQGCFDEVAPRIVETAIGPEIRVDILKDGKSLFAVSRLFGVSL